MLEVAGTDATNAFEDVGHSVFARIKLKSHLIGELVKEEHDVWENQYVTTWIDFTPPKIILGKYCRIG